MRTDKRRIQTAVLGGADSDEPLILPMEAIELDAFRRRYVRSSQAEVSRIRGRPRPTSRRALELMNSRHEARDQIQWT